jgi:hypothetical protein
MYFTPDVLEKLQQEYALVQGRYEKLLLSYNNRNYRFPLAKEYAQHGFLRRLGTLARCIENTFRALPPERDEEIPTREERVDATINIQAFIFNIFGAIDNLAWIWVIETELNKKDGSPLSNAHVGFGPKNFYVRQSLPPAIQEYLKTMDPWFRGLEDFRHSLAHRIPLYVPPYTVDPSDEREWQALEQQIFAASLRGDASTKARIEAEQKRLCRFRPWMKHSYSEQSRPIVFHAQLVTDFMTLEEFAIKLLPELPMR